MEKARLDSQSTASSIASGVPSWTYYAPPSLRIEIVDMVKMCVPGWILLPNSTTKIFPRHTAALGMDESPTTSFTNA